MPRGKVKKVIKKVKVEEVPNPMPRINPNFGPKYKVFVVILGILGILGIFWYKTKTWPVAALVNGRPVFRFELRQALESKYGVAILDDIITRKLIFQELAKRKVVADPASIEAKLSLIQKRFSTVDQFNQAMAKDGLTLPVLKERLSMQIALEMLVEPSTDAAKLQKEVVDMVNKWKTKATIWTTFDK